MADIKRFSEWKKQRSGDYDELINQYREYRKEIGEKKFRIKRRKKIDLSKADHDKQLGEMRGDTEREIMRMYKTGKGSQTISEITHVGMQKVGNIIAKHHPKHRLQKQYWGKNVKKYRKGYLERKFKEGTSLEDILKDKTLPAKKVKKIHKKWEKGEKK